MYFVLNFVFQLVLKIKHFCHTKIVVNDEKPRGIIQKNDQDAPEKET